MGFEGVKTRIASGFKADLKQIASVRSHVGPDIKVMVDAYCCYSVDSAIRLAIAMAETAIGQAANLHFAGVIGAGLLEYDGAPYQPLRDDILRDPVLGMDRLEKGRIMIPDGPGLGIDIDESVFEKYPYRPGHIYPDIYPHLSGGTL